MFSYASGRIGHAGFDAKNYRQFCRKTRETQKLQAYTDSEQKLAWSLLNPSLMTFVPTDR
jgi:hypothetical protein